MTMLPFSTTAGRIRERIRPMSTIGTRGARKASLMPASSSFIFILVCLVNLLATRSPVWVVSAKEGVSSSMHQRALQGRPPEQDVTPAPFGPPTRRPTAAPVIPPTLRPTVPPTKSPTRRPTRVPTRAPTRVPTREPTVAPTGSPTGKPTRRPTVSPTNAPTRRPTRAPTRAPTRTPTREPSVAPTGSPTGKPTRRPTVAPTALPTIEPSVKPITAIPTHRRTQLIVFTPPPTFTMSPVSPPFFGSFTAKPSVQPVLAPTRVPATPRPTRVPTRPPTTEPTFRPTRRPTSQPTRRPRATARPTKIPATARPTRTPTLAPTKGNAKKSSRPISVPTVAPSILVTLERVVVPINFEATVALPEGISTENEAAVNLFSARVAGIWERYLATVLQEQAGLNDNVSWIGIDLTVVPLTIPDETATEDSTRLRRRLNLRIRWLQDAPAEPESIRLDTTGSAAFEIDTQKVNEKVFLQDVGQVLAKSITAEKLQEALDEAGNDATVSAVTYGQNTTPGSNKPSTTELVIGFIILGLAVASLAYWGVVFHRKHQKKLAKRRSIAVAKKRTRTIVQTPPRAAPVPLTKAETSSDGSGSSYKGLGSEEDDGVSDPFGRELEQAASLDRVAWDDFQQKKQYMENQPIYTSPNRSPYGAVGVLPMYGSPSSQEGVEVDAGGIPRTGSFPYGDERDLEMPSNPPSVQRQAVALTADDAVKWTAAGVALNVAGATASNRSNDKRGKESFDLYGDSMDSRLEPSYGDSLGGDTARKSRAPALEEEKPSQYSFLYPLKKQDPNDPSGRASPTEASADASSAAVRTSPTSWSTSLMGTARASPPEGDASRDSQDYENENPDNDDDEDDSMTEEMVKEVEELSEFVKRYEKKKSLRQQKVQEGSQRMNASSELRSIPVGQPKADGRSSEKTHSVPIPSKRAPVDSERSDRVALSPAPANGRSQRDSRIERGTGASPVREPHRMNQSRSTLPPEGSRTNKAIIMPASDFLAPKVRGTPDRPRNTFVQGYKPVAVGYGSYEATSESGSDTEAEVSLASVSSQRLGISRFSVQKPPAPLLSFKADPKKEPPAPVSAQATTRGIPQDGAVLTDEENDQGSSGLDEGSSGLAPPMFSPVLVAGKKEARVLDDEITPKQKGGKKGVLSSLRGSKAMLDSAAGSEPPLRSSPVPFDEKNAQPVPPSQTSRTRPKNTGLQSPFNMSPRTRSKSKSFNNIMSMFESKPKTPIAPASETWQYNS